MQEVIADARNAIVQPALLLFCLLPVHGAFDTPRQLFVSGTKLLEERAKRFLVLKLFAVAQGRKAI